VSPRTSISLVLFLVLAGTAAGGDSLVHITTIDQETPYIGQLSRVDKKGTFHLTLNSGKTVALSGRRIVTVQFSASKATRGPARLDLVGNDRLYGTLSGEDEMGIVLSGTLLPRVTVPLERVKTLQFPAALKGLKERPHVVAEGGKDVVFKRLKNSVDRVTGTVDLIGPEGVTLDTSLGSLPFSLSSLVAVAFAAPDDPRPIQGLHAVVLGADGSRLTGVIKGTRGGRLDLETQHGFPASILLRHVKTLYFRGGDLVFLSDLKPVEVVERSYFPGVVWKHCPDRTTLGNPLRLGGVEYPKGLGVHAYCALTYELDGKYSRFQSWIGVDDEVKTLKARGTVEFRVLVDGKEAFRSPVLRGSEPPGRIKGLDVKGVRKITLVVDFADRNHAGDRADWALALLVKQVN